QAAGEAAQARGRAGSEGSRHTRVSLGGRCTITWGRFATCRIPWQVANLPHHGLLLLRRDRLGERSNHCGNDVVVDQLLADLALIAVRLAEGVERLPAPVLTDREVGADRGLVELAGADLVGVGPRFDAEPALQPATLVEREHQRGF